MSDVHTIIEEQQQHQYHHHDGLLDEDVIEDSHHVPLWILFLIGVFVAVLILLPNVWFAKRPIKND